MAYYARKFYITPKHLSAVVKEISGRTAGDWIENYAVMEAKVLAQDNRQNYSGDNTYAELRQPVILREILQTPHRLIPNSIP